MKKGKLWVNSLKEWLGESQGGERESVCVRERERERDSSMIVVFQSEKEAVKGER